MAEYIRVAAISDIPANECRVACVAGVNIVMFNINGEFSVLEDRCSHAGYPLSDGPVEGDQITCPWHYARFNIRSGQPISGPAPEAIRKFKLRIVEDYIEVAI